MTSAAKSRFSLKSALTELLTMLALLVIMGALVYATLWSVQHSRFQAIDQLISAQYPGQTREQFTLCWNRQAVTGEVQALNGRAMQLKAGDLTLQLKASDIQTGACPQAADQRR